MAEIDLESYRRDGVVHLKKRFQEAWLDLLSRGIQRDMADPGSRYEERTAGANTARYCENFWAWAEIPEFRRFVLDSPAGEIAARLMGARRINLVMDNWFRREAGAQSRPPWHHDIAYFDFEGTMCVLWLPLEPCTRQEGITFVRGSHLWGRLFQRVFFKSHQAMGEPGEVNGLHYEPPPDIDANPDAYDLVAFDCEPGDCIMFDIRTLHGTLGESIPAKTSHRFTLRMAAENGCIRYRGDWATQERQVFEARGYQDGDPIAGAFFPQLWPKTTLDRG